MSALSLAKLNLEKNACTLFDVQQNVATYLMASRQRTLNFASFKLIMWSAFPSPDISS
jgi:hypothetical protein